MSFNGTLRGGGGDTRTKTHRRIVIKTFKLNLASGWLSERKLKLSAFVGGKDYDTVPVEFHNYGSAC